MSDEFDVQQRSPFTPEGQIESAGHFSRGLARRYGPDRVRRVVGRSALVAALVLAVVAVVGALS